VYAKPDSAIRLATAAISRQTRDCSLFESTWTYDDDP